MQASDTRSPKAQLMCPGCQTASAITLKPGQDPPNRTACAWCKTVIRIPVDSWEYSQSFTED
jgi:hypothetical protein